MYRSQTFMNSPFLYIPERSKTFPIFMAELRGISTSLNGANTMLSITALAPCIGCIMTATLEPSACSQRCVALKRPIVMLYAEPLRKLRTSDSASFPFFSVRKYPGIQSASPARVAIFSATACRIRASRADTASGCLRTRKMCALSASAAHCCVLVIPETGVCGNLDSKNICLRLVVS